MTTTITIQDLKEIVDSFNGVFEVETTGNNCVIFQRKKKQKDFKTKNFHDDDIFEDEGEPGVLILINDMILFDGKSFYNNEVKIQDIRDYLKLLYDSI